MRPIDIGPADLETVQRILRKYVPEMEVRAFGSRVSWTARETSDLDLTLITDEPFSIARMAELKAAFTESNLPFRVDIVDWASTSEAFRQRILANQLVLRSRAVALATEDGPTGITDGLLPETWETMPFTDAFQINPAVPIKRGSPMPFVDMAAIDPNVRSVRATETRKFRGGGSRFQNGDTLMARITPCLENGKVARYRADSKTSVGYGSTEFIVVRGRPELTDTDYAFYLARSDHVRDYAIGQMTGTSGRQRVPTESFAHFDVAVPPLPEQRAIARILGTLDDKIELNRRMNETLEAMARALFKSWFVDFDPVRAKMEDRDTGLPKEIADLFPDRLVDSELGEIPEGWALVSLPDLIEVNPSRSLRRGEIAPYLDMATMPTRSHSPDSVVQRPFTSGMRFTNGDTLVARITPCLENGKTAYVDFLGDGEIGWGSTEYIVMKSRHPLPGEFSYLLARSKQFREFAVQNMSGTSGRQRVPATALSGFLIPSPPAAVGMWFGRAAQSFLERARMAVDECRALANCRDALLPKLVKGELRIQDADKLTGAIVTDLTVATVIGEQKT